MPLATGVPGVSGTRETFMEKSLRLFVDKANAQDRPKGPGASAKSRSVWASVLAVFCVLAIQTVRVHLFPDPRVVSQAQRQYWAQVPVSTSREISEIATESPWPCRSPPRAFSWIPNIEVLRAASFGGFWTPGRFGAWRVP